MALGRYAIVAAASASAGIYVGSEKEQIKAAYAKVRGRLGFRPQSVDLASSAAILEEALNLTRATPQNCGVLSTVQSGGVASRVIQLREPFGVRRDGDDVSVHFFTSAASRKFRELSQNPKTALLCWDPQTLTYVTFQGSAQELSAAEGKGFWREWMQILYKDTSLFSAWRLDVERLQVVSIGHIESFRKDWHPVELERTSSGWKVVCDGRE
ncbi:pdxH [Symbiodinium sp. CCMP2592]|nr:pdxH [Symbiodinium sp. CCMP2592]